MGNRWSSGQMNGSFYIDYNQRSVRKLENNLCYEGYIDVVIAYTRTTIIIMDNKQHGKVFIINTKFWSV